MLRSDFFFFYHGDAYIVLKGRISVRGIDNANKKKEMKANLQE